jgi:hypothetical protein
LKEDMTVDWIHLVVTSVQWQVIENMWLFWQEISQGMQLDEYGLWMMVLGPDVKILEKKLN